MTSAPFGTISPAFEDTGMAYAQEAAIAQRLSKAAPQGAALSGKRAEDTGAGCRAKAAADLVRAHAPGGDYMRQRLEQSAAVWAERASLLERLEKKFVQRTLTA